MGWCFATPLQCLLAGSIHGFDRATDARPVVSDYFEVEDFGFACGGGGTPLADSGKGAPILWHAEIAGYEVVHSYRVPFLRTRPFRCWPASVALGPSPAHAHTLPSQDLRTLLVTVETTGRY